MPANPWGLNMGETAIRNLEERVERLEKAVKALSEGVDSTERQTLRQTAHPISSDSTAASPSVGQRRGSAGTTPSSNVVLDQPTSTAGNSQFLGAVGVFCFILAGSYSIRLGITSGWITPMMQLAAVAIFGIGLVMAGFALRERDNQ